MKITSSSALYNVEPYGSLSNNNMPLLKILGNGLPIYQVSPLWMEKEEPIENSDTPHDIMFKTEKRLKTLAQPFTFIRHKLEKYFLIRDYDIRTTQASDNIWSQNKDMIRNCRVNKDHALQSLCRLRQALQLTGIEIPNAQRVLALMSSITSLSNKDQWTFFAVMLAHRATLYERLISDVEHQAQLCQTAIQDQLRFLRIVNEVKTYWPLGKMNYAQHVFEKGDDYPYRAELHLDLMKVPWNCWGFQRLSYKAMSLTLHNPGEMEHAYDFIPPPFLCWPPLPSSHPCSPASAEIFFTAANGTPSPNRHLNVQIRWVGDAAYCIESKRQLRVRLIPVFSSDDMSTQNDTHSSSSGCPPFGGSTVTAFDSNHKTIHDVQSLSLTPRLLDSDDGWAEESKDIHRRLQVAQWTLVDRAVHLIYQAQAARLKSLLDTVSYGTSGACEAAWCILEREENFKRINAFYTNRFLQNENLSTRTNAFLNDLSDELLQNQRKITVDDWSPYGTSLTLRNCPIYLKPVATPTQDSQTTSTSPVFFVDLGVRVSYEASSPLDTDTSNTIPFQDILQQLLRSNTPAAKYKVQFLQNIPVVEALATCFLRHLFLLAWKYAIRDVPKLCFDLNVSTVESPQSSPGHNLFIHFIDWLEAYLEFNMVAPS